MLVVALRDNDKVIGARISSAAIDVLLKELAPAGELAHYELKSVKRETAPMLSRRPVGSRPT